MIDTKSTEFLLSLYDRFGDKAQDALNFVKRNQGMKDDEIPAANFSLANGVYLIYKDGSYIEYTEQPVFTDYISIGIAHDGHYFRVPLYWDYGKQQLLKEDGYNEDSHCVCETDMLMNWDFVGETEYLRQLGLAFVLRHEHYIPTGPVFLAMYANRNQLNAALTAAGSDEIDFKKDYWVAQRNGVYNAWLFYGYNRSLINDYVYYASQVCAVAPWEPR